MIRNVILSWESLATSYRPIAVEVCEQETRKRAGRTAATKPGGQHAGLQFAFVPTPYFTLVNCESLQGRHRF